MAIRHAELLCCVIHQFDKHFGTARDMLSNGNTRVIPRNNGNAFNDLLKRHFRTQLHIHF